MHVIHLLKSNRNKKFLPNIVKTYGIYKQMSQQPQLLSKLLTRISTLYWCFICCAKDVGGLCTARWNVRPVKSKLFTKFVDICVLLCQSFMFFPIRSDVSSRINILIVVLCRKDGKKVERKHSICIFRQTKLLIRQRFEHFFFATLLCFLAVAGLFYAHKEVDCKKLF